MLFEPDQVVIYSEEFRVVKDYLSDIFVVYLVVV